MAPRRGSQKLDGWIVIDKPVGPSSAAIVGKVRRLLDATKAGHGGTLDPLASGVLPLALGEATKTVSYVMDGAKIYRWRVTWGEARSTDDGEGEVIARSDMRPDRAQIEAALPRFTGEILQTPPTYSAIKLDGERAYDLARSGEIAALQPRLVRIDRLSLLETGPDWAELEMECGKGTYVRALARDLGQALGTVGYVSALRRTQCGPFHEDQAISLETLAEFRHSAAAAKVLLPVSTALDDIPALALTEDEARRLRSGQRIPIQELLARCPIPSIAAGQTVRAVAEGQVVALARIEDGLVRPVRVLNL